MRYVKRLSGDLCRFLPLENRLKIRYYSTFLRGLCRIAKEASRQKENVSAIWAPLQNLRWDSIVRYSLSKNSKKQRFEIYSWIGPYHWCTTPLIIVFYFLFKSIFGRACVELAKNSLFFIKNNGINGLTEAEVDTRAKSVSDSQFWAQK